MTDIFVQSFIKGLGKTTAALVVCGLTGGVLYYFTNQNNYNLFDNVFKKSNNVKMINMETITENTNETNETNEIDSENGENENIVENYVENMTKEIDSEGKELDAKKLFDEMISKKRKWGFV